MLTCLSETLGNFLEYVGGQSFAMHLIRPLEQLSSVEENSVREKAIESIKKVLSQVSIKENEEDVMGIIRRLVNGEWYSTKIAGVSLIPFVFLQVRPEFQQELIKYHVSCTTIGYTRNARRTRCRRSGGSRPPT